MTLTLVINGRQMIKCTLPSEAEPLFTLRDPSIPNLHVRDLHSFHTHVLCIYNGNGGEYEATLLVNNHLIRLGAFTGDAAPLPQTRVVQAALSGKCPKAFVVTIRRCPSGTACTETGVAPRTLAPDSQAEGRLIAEIVAILQGEEYQGSHQSTGIQMLVSNSENYAPTFLNYPKEQSWHTFLTAHSDIFSLFAYTAKDIAMYNLYQTCHPGELRIALTSTPGEFVFEEDIRRERITAAAYDKVMEFIMNQLSGGEVDAQTLMHSLAEDCPEYAVFMKPSYVVFERILRSDSRFRIEEGTNRVTYVGNH